MGIERSVKVVEAVALDTGTALVVDVETQVGEVLERMRGEKSGCAMVTRDQKLVGIFTERDVLMKVVGNPEALRQPVSACMTEDPATLGETDAVLDALALMHRGGFRNVPIVDAAGRVVSCIRHKDIIHYLVEHFADRVLNLPPDPDQVAKAPDGA